MRRTIIFQFGDAQPKMGFLGMVLRRSKFPMKLVRADVRRVLITYHPRIKRLVGNGERIFAWLRGPLTHGKGIFPDEAFRLEAEKLYDDVVAHEELGSA